MKHRIIKQHIWESFYELLTITPFEKLTVERIAAHSGVAKSTFYRHFQDKYDVMNYNSEALVNRLIGGRFCRDWYEFLLFMFQEIEKDKEYYRRVFRTSGQNAHSRFLFEYTFGFVKSRYLSASGHTELTKWEQYEIGHYCHGSVDTLEDWLREASPMQAEEMAKLYYDAMPQRIRAVWSSNSNN